MEADTFMPCIRRSDGVLFSMETIVDMKALGFDTEAELQNPAAKGEPITKRYEGGKLALCDELDISVSIFLLLLLYYFFTVTETAGK